MSNATAEHWIRTESDRQAVADGCVMDESAGQRVIAFIETFCKIADPRKPAAGMPLVLEAWQRDMIVQLFGWMRADGTRRFRFAWIEIAKKNGKSTLAAALILYLLVADGEADAELYGVATTREQAGIIFREASKMLDRSPQLQRVVEARPHVKRLLFERAHGFYAVLPNKPSAVDGINAHAIVFDEIHRQANRELYDALAYAGAARRQPLQLILTTAGDDRESIGYELHERAEGILQGSIVDTETYAFIAAAAADADAGDPDAWADANPNLGVTIDAADLATEYERAKDSPARMQNFRRLRLNQWVSQVSRWLDYDRWMACPERPPAEQLLGREAYGGLDLSTSIDLSAFVIQMPSIDPTDGRRMHDVQAWFWLPEDNIEELERLAGVPYREWARQGLIELTPGDVIDYSYIRKRITEVADQYELKEIAYDPSGATQLAVELGEQGLPMFQFWQRPTMMNPVLRYLESAVMDRRLRHGSHPILNWMAGNVEVIENSDGLLKPTKPRNSGRKIDGIAALAMAMGTHCKQAKEDKDAAYEESPLITF
jgi:phage terminase large subunit-like protein